jgi:DNA repair exonuclease SbcCD ATPase subunit
MKNETTTDLTSQIETTAIKLTELETEQSELSQAIADAANAADSVSLITLAHRRNNLPIEILSTRISLERLYQQRDEEKLPGLQAEAQRLSEPISELQARLQAVQLELNIAIGAQIDAAQNAKDIKSRIAERRRQIEDLLHSARNVKIAPNHLSMSGSN